MMNDPKLKLVEILTSARTFHFQSAEALGGWALCTVNDTTGELLVMSDWGNWTHRWNPKHLGSPTLSHLIAERNTYDYLANKLLGKHDCWMLDADATVAKWRQILVAQRLCEGRRERSRHDREPLTAVRAREIWEALGSLFEDEHDESIFIEHAMQIDGIEWISEEPWESTVHRYSHEYKVLVDFLLPALAKACAQTVSDGGRREASICALATMLKGACAQTVSGQ
jgi:hypothetical protein